MSSAVVLDSRPLGILTNPSVRPHVVACQNWLDALLAAGRRVILPEISDYEVRRELNWIKSAASVNLLDQSAVRLEYIPINTAAMRLAADLWAQARGSGMPTAPDPALDGDVILAAQAIILGVPVVVATTNVSHLSCFVPAELWSNITP